MNKKTLTTAVLAGLTGIAGIVSVSNAVHINPDGTGQVLIYPYYTTRNDNVTLISVVNTSPDAKAVKVRFLEGINSAEVRDFNLYMSPFDVWTTTIATVPGGEGARFVTRDNTCTVPRFFDVATGTSAADTRANFVDFQFAGPTGLPDTGPRGLDRTREGYIELIEMGTLLNSPGPGGFDAATFTIHGGPADANGNPTPLGCGALNDAWSSISTDVGVWNADNQFNLAPPTGGLFGDGVVVNVPGARAFGYSATALSAFYVPGDGDNPSLHTDPGSTLPSLASASPFTSSTYLAAGNGAPVLVNETWPAGILATSASMMVDQVANQFDVDPSINGHTEWVVTFPTRRFHVFPSASLGIPPFVGAFPAVNSFAGASGLIPFGQTFSCEPIFVTIFDRNEQTTGTEPVPSPNPTGSNELCTEVNVITFDDSATVGDNTPVLGAAAEYALAVNFDVQALGFTSGWMQLAFNADNDISVNNDGAGAPHVLNNGQSGNDHKGLPTVGFAVRSADNSAINALFAASVNHAYTRIIE